MRLIVSLFKRSLAFCYFLAFISLLFQYKGLWGEHGISPIKNLPVQNFFQNPSIFLFNSSDNFILLTIILGLFISTLLIFGFKNKANYLQAVFFFLLYLIYLSFLRSGGVFLSFQWDILLLEMGFITVLERLFFKIKGAENLFRWIYLMLVCKLMLMSGFVKLASKDPAWLDLSALQYHFFAQPIPNPLAFWAHQMPLIVHKINCFIMFVIELLCPFLIVWGSRARAVAGVSFIALQLVIILTGNYCFFNLLTIVLSLWLFEDKHLLSILPIGMKENLERHLNKVEVADADALFSKMIKEKLNSLEPVKIKKFFTVLIKMTLVLIIVFYILIDVSYILLRTPFLDLNSYRGQKALLFAKAYPKVLARFYLNNPYGLFATMTKKRPEIIIQGASDLPGQLAHSEWKDYEFYFKPGDIKKGLPQVAPYQPRLDWQMWFAALGNYRQNPWFVNFLTKLLEGEKEVLALLKEDPFNGTPPDYVRALLYDYKFNDIDTYAKTGEIWQRNFVRLYLGELSLRRGSQ